MWRINIRIKILVFLVIDRVIEHCLKSVSRKLLEQYVLEGSSSYSNIEKGYTYIADLHIEPFSILLDDK